MAQTTTDFDIVVIGGGIAGIYSAWRLLNADKENPELLKKWKKKGNKLRIAIYEGSDRMGGRIMTCTPPNFPGGMDVEIGGMRVVDSQKYMYSLIKSKLKLPIYEQAVGEPINIIFMRNKLLRTFQLADPNALPYNITEEERLALLSGGCTADNFLGWAVLKLIPGVNGLSGQALTDYLKTVVIDGLPLHQYGFWDLVSKVLSHEAREIAIKAVGYDCLGGNTNAVNSISEYFDFTPTAKFYMVTGGYDTIPWLLQQEFEKAGGKVLTGKWLENFDEVVLEDKTKGIQLNFHKQEKPVTAAAVILGLPPRSLELLTQTGPVMDPKRAPQLRTYMNSVAKIGLFKLSLVYEYPWWEKAAYVSKGRSLTDLPVRQFYYWGVESDPKTGTTGKAVSLIYNDAGSVPFWGGFRSGPLGENNDEQWPSDSHPGHTIHHVGSAKFVRTNKPNLKDSAQSNDPFLAKKRKNWDDHKAPKRMVDEAHEQVMLMHGVTSAPEPIDAAFKDWGDDPYGAAVHFWNIGYKSWEVMQAVTQPVKNVPCFICNEAWSENQTWAEGSLQSSEIMLQTHFKLSEPEWVPKTTN